LGARVTGRAAPSDSAALLVIAVCAAHRLDGDVRASGERMVSRARSMSAVRRRTTANDLPMGSGMSSSDPRPGRTSLRASSDCCTRVRPSSAESSPVTVATRSASRANCSTVKVRRTAEGNLATTCARCSRPTVSTRSAGRTRSAVTGRERKSRSVPNRSRSACRTSGCSGWSATALVPADSTIHRPEADQCQRWSMASRRIRSAIAERPRFVVPTNRSRKLSSTGQLSQRIGSVSESPPASHLQDPAGSSLATLRTPTLWPSRGRRPAPRWVA